MDNYDTYQDVLAVIVQSNKHDLALLLRLNASSKMNKLLMVNRLLSFS